ncbi:MAG: tetratricopeptide repeat protein [Pseudomonadota bacterium]|nr:tetratricopeptide repeat protein [Pseudomonadota bacterium]
MSPEQKKVEALLALGRNEEAVALADRLPGQDTPSVEFLRVRGRALRAAGRVFDAEASFREALALQPGDPRLLADLATTLLGQRRIKDAMPYAREAVALRPDVAAYHCLRGVVAEALGNETEAEEAMMAARELAPQDAEAHTVYGYHALRLLRVDAAERAFADALAIHPDRAEALRGLARCAVARGDWPSARTRWLDALSADPRQRDRELAPALVLGHPLLAPVRAAARVPIAVSVALAVAGTALFFLYPRAPGAVAMTVMFFALAAVGPLARSGLARTARGESS